MRKALLLLALASPGDDIRLDLPPPGQVCWEHYCPPMSECAYDDEHVLVPDPRGGVWARCRHGLMGRTP